jgi:hypothetical protein
MPSPFPGMDPWLESPEQWHNVHRILISLITAELNQILPEGFAATIDEQVYLLLPEDRYLPDVAVVRTPNFATFPIRQTTNTSGSVATITPSVEVQSREAEEIQIPYIKVVMTHGRRDVVTVIEVLSPINKTGRSRDDYQKKQRDLLDSEAHFLEIDLLRGGLHTVAVEESSLLATYESEWDYIVCLHRAGQGEHFSCWPFTVRESLPTVPVPLSKTHTDVPLALQMLLEKCYDDGPFRRTVDYNSQPTPRLKRSDAAWVQDLLLSNPNP